MQALRKEAPEMIWDDAGYQSAKKARATAYAEFCTAAGANPFRYGQEGFQQYYESTVEPLRTVFMEASDHCTAEAGRVVKESGGAVE